jgi:hypothetical protein
MSALAFSPTTRKGDHDVPGASELVIDRATDPAGVAGDDYPHRSD